MATYRIHCLEIVASYDQIPSGFEMRPTPQFISSELLQAISQDVDFAAAFADVQQNPYDAATAKSAASDARQDLLTKLNELSGGPQVGFDAAVYYRPTSSTHITEWFLTKSENGEAPKPWAFSLTLNGQTIKGYVVLMLAMSEESADHAALHTRPHVQKSVSKAVSGPDHERHVAMASRV